MIVCGKHYRSIWMDGPRVRMIDQNALPFEFRIFESRGFMTTARAIKNMTVRGAGAIGAAGAFGMAQAFSKSRQASRIRAARKILESTRPTAVSLFKSIKRVCDAAREEEDRGGAAVCEAQKIADENAEEGRKIGEVGERLLRDGSRVLTHCNAGWLAFVDWGSALAPVYAARRSGKGVFVYASETRPRSQGARLTAWELKNEGVPCRIIVDGAGAHLMSEGEVDVVIVGADRIARNGDTANKIGTLEKAIAAREYGIPFYVAAPTSTIDNDAEGGADIKIEHRGEGEVLRQTGRSRRGLVEKFLVCSPGSRALNPAFDVTPVKFISGFITERGVLRVRELGRSGGRTL
ncbi:MAG: S-methyl-5-thioribose-1-phosphate isomerase [Candidatus Micrarchaeota archaeon]